MYFFSNSPVRWRLTKVVYAVHVSVTHWLRLRLRLRQPEVFRVACDGPVTHLASATIANEDQLEGGSLLFRHLEGRSVWVSACVFCAIATAVRG